MSDLFDDWDDEEEYDPDDLEPELDLEREDDMGLDDDFVDDLDDALGDDELEGDDELDSELAGAVDVSCPYCGALVELVVDPVGGDLQEYVEDCEVCCQPWSVRVVMDSEGFPSVDVTTLDDG